MDFKAMKPREIESYLRQVVLDVFGDSVENQSGVYASHGFYSVYVITGKETFTFNNFRKTQAGKIAKALRALK